MIKAIKGVVRGAEKDFSLFLIAGIFLGIAQSVDGSTLTNYLKEHIGMLILQRSALEFPREIPGLLVFLVIGALSFLEGDARISVVANLLAAIGMFSLGVIPPHYALVIWSRFSSLSSAASHGTRVEPAGISMFSLPAPWSHFSTSCPLAESI